MMMVFLSRYGHAVKTKGPAIIRQPFVYMVRPLGLEPRAHGLKVRYSTN